jgi:hypothetical protein
MTRAQYRTAIKRLGVSIIGASKVFGISPRQAQRLASGESPVPAPIAKLITLALADKITVLDIEVA